jgi:hypothetical protein
MTAIRYVILIACPSLACLIIIGVPVVGAWR